MATHARGFAAFVSERTSGRPLRNGWVATGWPRSSGPRGSGQLRGSTVRAPNGPCVVTQDGALCRPTRGSPGRDHRGSPCRQTRCGRHGLVNTGRCVVHGLPVYGSMPRAPGRPRRPFGRQESRVGDGPDLGSLNVSAVREVGRALSRPRLGGPAPALRAAAHPVLGCQPGHADPDTRARADTGRARERARRRRAGRPLVHPSGPGLHPRSGYRRTRDRSRRTGVAARRIRTPPYNTPPRGSWASASHTQTDRSTNHGSAQRAADRG
jgi:hypothetical protein